MPEGNDVLASMEALNAKIDAQIARSRVLAEEAARVSAEATQTTATVTSSVYIAPSRIERMPPSAGRNWDCARAPCPPHYV